MKPKVLITREIIGDAVSKLRETCDVVMWKEPRSMTRDEFLREATGCQALITMLSEQVDAELLDHVGGSLKVVSNYAVGYNNIDVKEAHKRNIQVGNTPGALTEATADTAATLLLGAARMAADGMRAVSDGRWKCWEPMGWLGVDLKGKTLGIIGLGRIGYALARKFHFGWEMDVIYTSRTPKTDYEKAISAQRVELDELLSRADFISIHTDLNPETKYLIDSVAFSKMKPNAVLINTSRGQVVDQNALYEALKNQQITAAGLDVTDPEPLPLDSPLLSLTNIMILPHIGSATVDTRSTMTEIVVENTLRGLAGEPLLHAVVP